MSKLIITSQILEEITKHGLNIEKTLQQINSILKELPEEEKDANYINLGGTRENVFCWLIHHDTTTNNYYYLSDKYNNNKAWQFKRNNETPKKIITNLVNYTAKGKLFKKQGKPQDGYIIKELENNKPLTLLKAKNKSLVCFVCFSWFFSDGSPRIDFINIKESKEEYKDNFFLNNGGWDARRVRIDASNIFAIYNKDFNNYKNYVNECNAKRINRQNNRPLKMLKRYCYNDTSFLNGLLNDFGWNGGKLHLYNGFSHNSLLKHEFDTVESGFYISYKGIDYPKTTEPTTRQNIFNLLVDKSGYFVFGFQHELKERAKTLKAQREREQAEKNHTEWIGSDHTTESAIINSLLKPIVIMISERLQLEKVLNCETFGELKKLREIYLNLADFFKWERFADFNKWGAKLEETKKENNFYIKAIKNNILSKVACYHHYTETPDGYIMTTKDNFWRERYLNNF